MSPKLRAPLALGLLLLGGSSEAEAAPGQALQAGLRLSFTPGYSVPVGVGLDLGWALHNSDGGSLSRGTAYVAPGVQLDLLGFSVFQAALGVQGGGVVGDIHRYQVLDLNGFAGLALRTRGGPAAHLQLGARSYDRFSVYPLLPAFGPQLHLGADVPLTSRGDELPDWGLKFLQSESLSLGALCLVRLDDPYSDMIDGRPLREGGRPVLPRACALGPLDGAARAWLTRGRVEQASVPAFLQLAAELRALGAPRPLVGRALQAAREEAGHARLCYAMVARRTGQPVLAAPMAPVGPRPGSRRLRLSRLAVEALQDGIIGEGEAAARAARRRDAARDPLEARVEHRIVVEETRHARLAEDVLRWARSEGAGGRGRLSGG